MFAEQRELLNWAGEDFSKVVNIWTRYARTDPFSVKYHRISDSEYEVAAHLARPYPVELRKLVHNCTNAIKHCLDQVTNAFSQKLNPNCGELHFPWATSPEDLRGQLNRKHPVPQETFDLYKSFGCFYGEGGDKYFRDLAKAVNPAKHRLALAVRPVPAYDEVTGEYKAGVPINGSVTLADPGLLMLENDRYRLARGEGTFPRLKFNITPKLVFEDLTEISGEDVIGLTQHALNKVRLIIKDMEAWIDSRDQRNADLNN